MRNRNRMQQRREARIEAIARLKEVIARHEAKGDRDQADLFRELLVEAEDRLRAMNTHIVVGDHQPEPRIVHDRSVQAISNEGW